MLYYIVTTVATNLSETGSVLRESGFRFRKMVNGVPDLLPPLLVAYAISFSVYIIELVIAKKLTDKGAEQVNYVIKVVMLTVMMAYALHPSTADWPFSQKGTFVVQVTVLLMKMHS
jgi:hypothetical protein